MHHGTLDHDSQRMEAEIPAFEAPGGDNFRYVRSPAEDLQVSGYIDGGVSTEDFSFVSEFHSSQQVSLNHLLDACHVLG